MRNALRLVLTLATIAPLGCGSDAPVDIDPTYGTAAFPLKAYCSISVVNKGPKDLESDYLPHVIQCENGKADLEALKALAIAARSVAYYTIDKGQAIQDGQQAQVYSCGAKPLQKHYDAVNATKGQVLRYKGKQIYGFYVAGAFADGPGCYPTAAQIAADQGVAYPTEQYVTYNWGKTGDQVKSCPLSKYTSQNRGGLSQNGSRCLDDNGWTANDILRFYYGADIEIVTAPGSCGGPTDPIGPCIEMCSGATAIHANCAGTDCAKQGPNVTCVIKNGIATCVDKSEKCEAKCDGDMIYYANCGKGDCGVFGATCIKTNGEVSCGQPCVSKCDGNTIHYPDCSEGDCGAFGATCVMKDGTATCAAEKCKPKCDGALIYYEDCTNGDCGAFGATCIMKDGQPKCAPTGCEPACNGPTLVYADCTTSICSGQGSMCKLTNGKPECVPLACEPKCKGNKLLNSKCSWGDCTQLGATCQVKDGQAQCVTQVCNQCVSNVAFGSDCKGVPCEGITPLCVKTGGTAQCVSPECNNGNADIVCKQKKAWKCNKKQQLVAADPPPESCDGKDNNCDGSVDEGVKNACGECGEVPAEICDGKDNNCDGSVDEGFEVGESCTVSMADCDLLGKWACSADGAGAECVTEKDACDPPTTTGGETTAGETTGGDITAGETTGGDITSGETTGGDTTPDNDEAGSKPSEGCAIAWTPSSHSPLALLITLLAWLAILRGLSRSTSKHSCQAPTP